MSSTPLAELTGPMVVGLCLNWGLLGCCTVQGYNYYSFFPRDRRFLKALVSFLFLWDFAQTILYTQSMFQLFGPGFGSTVALEAVGTTWFSVPLMGGVSSAIVQCFYGWRVHMLSKSAALGGIIVLLAIVERAAGIAAGFILGFRVKSFAELQEKTFTVTSVWLLGSAVCDLTISVCMVYLLSSAKNKSDIRSTDSALGRLIHLSFGAGVITAIVAALDGCLYIVYQHENYHMAPAATLEKLYINSLLVLLNSRHYNRNEEKSGSSWGTDSSRNAVVISRSQGNVTDIRAAEMPMRKNAERGVEMDTFQVGNRRIDEHKTLSLGTPTEDRPKLVSDTATKTRAL